MSSAVIDNKRIAKNTVLLYVRTLFTMAISLYTSRVILRALGVEDYGVYQVVGGLVSMFSIISTSLSSAISRFITFEIGKGNEDRLKQIFSCSKIIQLGLAGIVAVVVEIVGLWFLFNQMQIPEGRTTAAMWVMQCSLLTFCVNLISVPYNACIIAHEHMHAFAYISILEAVAKLGICYLILISPMDRLIAYAILLAFLAIIIRSIYSLYCHKHFEESRVGFKFDPGLFREMAGFAGWSFFSNSTHVFNTQGVNMLFNVFFGVTANAARGIANQVESAVMSFVGNFTTAVNPQITKSYATGEEDGMYALVCRAAKFSYLAMLIFAVPILFETEKILNLWLTVVPEHTVIFVRMSLVLGMLDCIGQSSFTACMATGKLKKYSLIITPIGALEFPLVWIFFTIGSPVESAYYLYVLVKMLVLAARLYLMRDMLGFDPLVFIRKVYLRIIPTSLLSLVLPLLIVLLLPSSFIRLILTTILGVVSVGIFSLYVGMTQGERKTILTKVSGLTNKYLPNSTRA